MATKGLEILTPIKRHVVMRIPRWGRVDVA